MSADLLFWLFACLAVLIAGVSKGGFSGGPAMLATPVFALGSDPITAAAVMLPVLCFMDLLGLRAWWRYADWQDIKLLVPSAVVGIIAGAFLFRSVETSVLLILLGVLALSFSGWQVTGGAKARHPKPWVGCLCGLVAGFSSTMAHAGAPPLSVYLLSRKLSSKVYVGTATVFFTATNGLKLIPYSFLDLLPKGNLIMSLALMPIAWLGIQLGIYLHHHISQQVFFRVAYIALAIVGVVLIYRGFLLF